MSGKKRDSEDMALFREAMSDVRPLKSPARQPPENPKPPPSPTQRERDERVVIQELLDAPEDLDGLETGEELRFLRPGYQKRYLTRLQRGRYSIQDHLDLHHMNVETARQALLDFIDTCIADGRGCVRVVHGKGLRSRNRPRLKEMTRHVLRRHPGVIAFASCRPVDGGTGAVAVLLRIP